MNLDAADNRKRRLSRCALHPLLRINSTSAKVSIMSSTTLTRTQRSCWITRTCADPFVVSLVFACQILLPSCVSARVLLSPPEQMNQLSRITRVRSPYSYFPFITLSVPTRRAVLPVSLIVVDVADASRAITQRPAACCCGQIVNKHIEMYRREDNAGQERRVADASGKERENKAAC